MDHSVSYARVSSVEQRERGLSIEAQIRFIRKYAKDHDLKIIHEFVEVETAKVTGRPRFKDMQEFLKKSTECRIILVEKTDRLYRNFQDMVDLDKLGVEIHFTKEGAIIGPQARSSDKFMHGIRVLMAKNYSDNLSEEVKKGHQEKVLRGEWPHGAPWGYLNNKELRIVEPDPVKSVIVKWLYRRYAEGDISVKRLHEEYENLGFNVVLGRSYIHKILRNPFYKGVMRWKGKIYPAKHEALVDVPTWETVQILLDTYNKASFIKSGDGFTYRHIIKCGHCGCSIVPEIKKGKYIYYHCTEKRKTCKVNGWIRQEVLDQQFQAEIQQLKLSDDEISHMQKKLRSLKEQEKQNLIQEDRDLRLRIKKLQKKLENRYRKQVNLLNGRVSLDEQYDTILEELSNLTERLKEIQSPNISVYTEYENQLEFINRSDKLFQTGTILIRRKVIETLFDEITLIEGEICVKPRLRAAIGELF